MTSLGFQVSSLRPHLTTAQEVLSAFHRLHAMGYRVLQIQWIAPEVEDEAVARALRETGLRCIGVQDRYFAVREQLERFIAQNKLWGGAQVCVSGIPPESFTARGLTAYAAELSSLADRLRAEGLSLTFHPIFSDYAAVDGVPALDRLMEALPADVTLTLCIYHAHKAGLDPCAVLARYAGRVDAVHFKNSVAEADGGEQLMPIGQGGIDWPPIFEACHRTKVPWGLVEQERWNKDAFLCAQESYDYVTRTGGIR